MRVIKSLTPTVIFLILTYYFYQEYGRLSETVVNGLIFLPHLLAILAIGSSIHFSRSTVFFYAILIIIVNTVISFHWAATDLSYALLSGFTPLLLVMLSILPDRGIISTKAVPAYALLIITAIFSIYVVDSSTQWVAQLFLMDWLPTQYFDWTRLSQTVIIISVGSVVSMLVLFFLRPSPHTSAGLGVVLILIAQLHVTNSGQSLIVLTSAALFLCLYAVLQESWRMAYLDELTGLPARRALREKFQTLNGEYTVAMLDVDHFKKFNDNYGHDTGDAVLRMIAGKLNRVGGGGTPYRYGGEEFSIIFTGKNTQDARQHLDTLREVIANSVFVVNRASRRAMDSAPKLKKNKSVKVTVSIGLSTSTAATESPWDVLKLADKALYRAKNKGRNCVSG